MADTAKKPVLSNRLMGMKFMQRASDKAKQQAAEQEPKQEPHQEEQPLQAATLQEPNAGFTSNDAPQPPINSQAPGRCRIVYEAAPPPPGMVTGRLRFGPQQPATTQGPGDPKQEGVDVSDAAMATAAQKQGRKEDKSRGNPTKRGPVNEYSSLREQKKRRTM